MPADGRSGKVVEDLSLQMAFLARELAMDAK